MSEYEEQKLFVQWLDMKKLLFTSVPNENNMSFTNRKVAMIQGAKLKATGKRKGAPDLFVFLPNKVVAVEMKRALEKGKSKPAVSKEQKSWIEKLNKLGHPAKVCYGWNEARVWIREHLGEKNCE